ncbi:MAG: hypothetical protein ABIQ73_29880 [Acidimicrobiales bacterium]
MTTSPTRAAQRCRRKFLRIFPGGFHDETYLAWERDYKWSGHRAWVSEIGRKQDFRTTLDAGHCGEIAATAARIESSRSLLFSFEKMALRDAVVRSTTGAQSFALGLYDWLHGEGGERERFERWVEVMRSLPRRQTRVATWPALTVFGFLARPRTHFFLKPTAMRRAADAYGFDLDYSPRLTWQTYASAIEFSRVAAADLSDLQPRDQIDIQSFLWVQGSDEYE